MEITFTQLQSYSLDLDAKDERALAKHLGITRKRMLELIADGELMDEHYDGVTEWVENNISHAQVTEHENVEIEEICA